MTKQLYFNDPLTLEFTAQVTESRPLGEGRFGLIMPRTYFYPTSGGQEHDTGSIGEARILDVYKVNGDIVHVAEKALALGEYPACIDRMRRIRAMQHHTAQHILSASFLKVADIDSISANINGENPSTIDLDAKDVSDEILQRAEQFANGIFFENREVKTYDVSHDEIGKIPVRKPPKVSGLIRVVEVDGFDYTPCGGTHCPTTGMIGLLKIIKTEHVKHKLRIHFVAGYQALEYFQQMQSIAQSTALIMNTALDDVVSAVEKLQEQLKQAQNEVDGLRGIVRGVEAEKLIASAETVGKLRLVTALYENRPASDLRSLADKLRRESGVVAILASYNGAKLSMVTTCSQDTGVNARDLLQDHLAPIGAQGGGDASLAQGGGVTNKSALELLFKQTKNYLNVS